MNIFSNKVFVMLGLALVFVLAYIYVIKPRYGSQQEQEGFHSGYWTDYDRHRLRPKMARHAVMNYLGSADYVSSLAPPQKSLNFCVPTGCSDDLDQDVVCWNCDEQIAEPQNELHNMVN